MAERPLIDLEQRDDFIRRHIGPSPDQIADMLDVLGLSSLDDLIEKAVPEAIISGTPLSIGAEHTER